MFIEVKKDGAGLCKISIKRKIVDNGDNVIQTIISAEENTSRPYDARTGTPELFSFHGLVNTFIVTSFDTHYHSSDAVC